MMTDFISSMEPAVLDHLWQTTAFAGLVWVVTVAHGKAWRFRSVPLHFGPPTIYPPNVLHGA